LASLFYAEEDWRGKRAWKKCKAELEAKGYVLDWNKYTPSTIPNDENIFKAPKMQEWFVDRGGSELSKRIYSTNENLTAYFGTSNLIVTAEAAQKYLSWSKQFEPDLNLIREALKRPYARMDGNYSSTFEIPAPNFMTVRAVAQLSAQRAHCYIVLNHPDRALDELTLLHNLRGALQPPPSGRPETLIAAMIDVAVMGLYANEVEEGFQKNVWQEPQLLSLQKQLQEIHLIPILSESLREKPAHECQFFEELKAGNEIDKKRHVSLLQIANSWRKNWNDSDFLLFNVAPKGWLDQNLVTDIKIYENFLDALASSDAIIFPKKMDAEMQRLENSLKGHSPFKIIAQIAIPHYSKALQTTAHNQTMVNEAQIACALERYRIAHGEYPETLDALAPQFIAQIPHDIIGGESLIYHPTFGGKFLLYSVGWNETDDDGKDGGTDFTRGDWVWKN
jgi:hypothetical protein